MINDIILLKQGEIVLKGLNRRSFEQKLMSNIKRRLDAIGKFKAYCMQSTVYIEPVDETSDMDAAFEAMTKVFGLASVNRAAGCEKDPKKIAELAIEYLKDDMLVHIEVRDLAAYVHAAPTPGAGGMPVGANGVAVTLLSGGIDSPVSTYMIAKRGVRLIPVHFFSFPYTSEQAKQKVIELARLLTVYCGRMTIEVVPFTHIQEEIRAKCDEDYFTLIMRRFMMRIAQKIADANGAKAIVTGENLGQVASQTMEAMASTQAVTDLPVLQPLIGMDKEEIVRLARKIGTFETSILPYEDCCTVFTPKHPKTKPKLRDVEQIESALDIDALVEEAYAGIERIKVGD